MIAEPTGASPIPWVQMATLEELALVHTPVKGEALAHVQRLRASWRPLADLSFSDLLLLAPIAGEEGHRFVVLAQVRPDHRPDHLPAGPRRHASSTRSSGRCSTRALAHGRDRRGRHAALGSKERVRVQCIPMRHARPRRSRCVTRESPITFGRRAGELERPYLEAFDRFAHMIAEGSFPFAGDEIEFESAPRVGDGVIVLDAEHARALREPERGELAAPHGHPHVRAGPAPRRDRLRRRRGRRRDAARACRSPRRSSAATSSVLAAGAPAARRRRDRRRAHPAARRHRPPPPRPHAALEGRDDPRDPPPGEEQPADDRGAAAAAGPAARSRPRRRRRSRSRSGASGRSRSCTRRLSRDAGDVVHFDEIVRPLVRVVEETVVVARAATSASTVDGDAGELPGRGRDAARGRAQRADAERGRPRVPARATDARGQVSVRLAPRRRSRRRRRRRQRRRACPTGFSLEQSRGLGLSIVQALVTGELERLDRDAQRRRHDASTSRVPVAMPRVELCSAARRCGAGVGRQLASAARCLASQPLRSLRRSSSVSAAPDAGLLVGGERELEALAGDRALPRRSRLAASIWSSATPVRPDREEELGVVSRHAAAVAPRVVVPVVRPDPGQRHFGSPFVGRTARRWSCAPDHKQSSRRFRTCSEKRRLTAPRDRAQGA